jgi:hypothetical protein
MHRNDCACTPTDRVCHRILVHPLFTEVYNESEKSKVVLDACIERINDFHGAYLLHLQNSIAAHSKCQELEFQNERLRSKYKRLKKKCRKRRTKVHIDKPHITSQK